MWILPLLGYVGIISGFVFLTLAIASGLYYLSELVEEHTVISKRILTRLIQVIIVTHVLLLLFDGFPLLLTVLSAGSHAVYYMNMRKFPMVSLTDSWFIGSCILVIINHLLWFRHFSTPKHNPYSDFSTPSNRHKYTYGTVDYTNHPSFAEISSFFGLCVWLVPFSLFVSLSAGENVLPSMGGADGLAPTTLDVDGKGRKKGSKSILNSAIEKSWEWLAESAGAMGIGQAGARRPSTF